MWEDIPHALTFGEGPLLRQALLLGPFALSLLIVTIGHATSFGRLYSAGLVVMAVATAAAVLLHLRPDPRLLWLVPVLDLVGLSLMRLVPLPTASGVAVLVILPALWLGADYLMRGVWMVAGLGLLTMTVPTLLYYGTAPPELSRALMTPLTMTLCALTIAAAKRLWLVQAAQLEEQGRELEQALHESVESRTINEAIVSAVDVGLVLLDGEGRYVSANPRHGDFMRLAYPDGLDGQVGQPGFVYAADRRTALEAAEMPTARALDGEPFSDLVVWVGEHSADQRALSVSARPIHDRNGQVDGAVLVYKDVTDIMTALKMRDDFVASVSHELRTPLTSIIGFLDLLLDRSDVDAATRAHLDIVRRNAERLYRLVSDLLLIAKTDHGRLVLTATSTDLSALLGQAVSDIAPLAQAGGVEIESRIDPAVFLVIDPVRIRQMVDNLLSNAVKYTPPGGVVTVTLEDDAEAAILRVADTGIGIAQADLDRLFNRFFRAEAAEARAIPGVGLGLAITKSIVEAHNGVIAVESRTEHGTDFEVRLPRRRARVEPLERPSQSSLSPS